jgi:hypothetical protein
VCASVECENLTDLLFFDGVGFGFAGPGTVLCDNLCYVFMFLSVATSNLIATSLAQKVALSLCNLSSNHHHHHHHHPLFSVLLAPDV